MTTQRSLPAQPSLESIRKQAKKLARDVSAGDVDALERAQTQVPGIRLPLSLRDAQLVVAREYGFNGWPDLTAEVLNRTGKGLEWAAVQAQRAIHANDVDRLTELLAEHPELLSWHDDDGATLLQATTSYGDSSDPAREEIYCRPECAEVLIDAGGEVEPPVWENLLVSGATGMLQLLRRKGALPATLSVAAAMGDVEAVHAQLGSGSSAAPSEQLRSIDDAFLLACRFSHGELAGVLLDRRLALDSGLRRRIDGGPGRVAFMEEHLGRMPLSHGDPGLDLVDPWRAFVVHRLLKAIERDDLGAFKQLLEQEPALLDDSSVSLQVQLFERAVIKNRGPFIDHLVAVDPALAHLPQPPLWLAVKYALEYGTAHLVPLLARVAPVPDDLPHAAGLGDMAAVRRWFDHDGQPMLGDLDRHYPVNDRYKRDVLHGGPTPVQHVLDAALAWACMNREFDIAAFLVERGADVNTRWSTHEPASILHECTLHANYEGARFLIHHGVDLTIRDHRWNATAEGWAYHAAKDEAMADLLAEARRDQEQVPDSPT